MKNNSYNIESLRKIIRELQKENRILRKKLNEYDKTLLIDDIDKEKLEENDNYDLDQGGRIINRYITNKMVLGFFSLFRDRKDVYAKRASNGGYYPQCENRWNDNCPINCGKEKICSKDCAFKKYQELTGNTLLKHFIGYKEDRSDVIGIYTTLIDNTCRFLAFDFDDHKEKDDKWIRETKEFVEVCKENNLDVLVERSSSGNGSHVWVFFREAIKVPLARMFGNLLIDKCLDSIKISSFEYYDRMYLSQDSSNGLGSLIALPLQGRAVKNGNSCFVDENFNAYEDQWDVILNKVTRYSEKQIREYITTLQAQFAEEEGN
ncbi:MAG: hypothetical protein KBT35_05690 [Firmicutes bacterium]|nr:hypothetical protein [Candidatus Colivicinus equi]